MSSPLWQTIWLRLIERPLEAFKCGVWLPKSPSSLVLSPIWPRTTLLREIIKLTWKPLFIKGWFMWTKTHIRWWSKTSPFLTCLIQERWELMFRIIGFIKWVSPLLIAHLRMRVSSITLTILQVPRWRRMLFLHSYFPPNIKRELQIQTKIGGSGSNRRSIEWSWNKIGKEWSWMASKQWCNNLCYGSHLPSEVLMSFTPSFMH